MRRYETDKKKHIYIYEGENKNKRSIPSLEMEWKKDEEQTI